MRATTWLQHFIAFFLYPKKEHIERRKEKAIKSLPSCVWIHSNFSVIDSRDVYIGRKKLHHQHIKTIIHSIKFSVCEGFLSHFKAIRRGGKWGKEEEGNEGNFHLEQQAILWYNFTHKAYPSFHKRAIIIIMLYTQSLWTEGNSFFFLFFLRLFLSPSQLLVEGEKEEK